MYSIIYSCLVKASAYQSYIRQAKSHIQISPNVTRQIQRDGSIFGNTGYIGVEVIYTVSNIKMSPSILTLPFIYTDMRKLGVKWNKTCGGVSLYAGNKSRKAVVKYPEHRKVELGYYYLYSLERALESVCR